jgi:hypothetical protein
MHYELAASRPTAVSPQPADPQLCSRCSLHSWPRSPSRHKNITLNMPQWECPCSVPFSIYACERPYDQAPALTKCESHEPLRSDNHIRLLKLFPPGWPDRLTERVTHEEDTNIQCDIYQVSLPSVTTKGRPYFATLSYAWGDPKPSKQIRCGETMVSVPQSLYDALVYIRHPRTPRLLWVDCLCIDQTNSEEKGRQVQRMHRIYSESHCISWLGVESDRERDLAAMLPVLSWFSDVSWSWYPKDQHETWHNVETHFKLNPLRGWSSLCDLPWEALYRCLNREIFSRLWCVQETLLARSNDLRTSVSHVNISVLSRSCDLLSVILRDLLLYDNIKPINASPRTITLLYSQCFGMSVTLAGTTNLGHYLPFIKFVRSGLGQVASVAITAMALYWKECSDPRDRIYALAGLCNLDIASQINYSKTALAVHHVFMDFTLYCLGDTMSLELFQTNCRLSTVRDRKNIRGDLQHRDWLHGLPSWCPDFAGPQIRVRELVDRNSWRSSPLRACRGRPASFTALTRRCVAAVGVYVGSVKSCSSLWRGQRIDEEDADFWSVNQQKYASIQRCASSIEGICPPSRSLWKLLLDVCSAGAHFGKCPAWSYVSNFLPARTRDRMAKSTVGAAWIMKYVPDLAPEGGLALTRKVDADTWDRAAGDVDDWLFDQSVGTRLFTTDHPLAPFGSGLDGTRVGDIVCVLYGSDVPFVLRQVGNKGEYKLIGECYVAGIMHGEALDMGLEEREFRLI